MREPPPHFEPHLTQKPDSNRPMPQAPACRASEKSFQTLEPFSQPLESDGAAPPKPWWKRKSRVEPKPGDGGEMRPPFMESPSRRTGRVCARTAKPTQIKPRPELPLPVLVGIGLRLKIHGFQNRIKIFIIHGLKSSRRPIKLNTGERSHALIFPNNQFST